MNNDERPVVMDDTLLHSGKTDVPIIMDDVRTPSFNIRRKKPTRGITKSVNEVEKRRKKNKQAKAARKKQRKK